LPRSGGGHCVVLSAVADARDLRNLPLVVVGVRADHLARGRGEDVTLLHPHVCGFLPFPFLLRLVPREEHKQRLGNADAWRPTRDMVSFVCCHVMMFMGSSQACLRSGCRSRAASGRRRLPRQTTRTLRSKSTSVHSRPSTSPCAALFSRTGAVPWVSEGLSGSPGSPSQRVGGAGGPGSHR